MDVLEVIFYSIVIISNTMFFRMVYEQIKNGAWRL